MIIRAAQMNSMARSSRSGCIERIADWLHREGDPAFQRMTGAERHEFVRTAMVPAATLGLTSDRGIAWFSDVLMQVGPNFYQQPAIHGCLTIPNVSDETKIRRTIAFTREADWLEAEEL